MLLQNPPRAAGMALPSQRHDLSLAHVETLHGSLEILEGELLAFDPLQGVVQGAARVQALTGFAFQAAHLEGAKLSWRQLKFTLEIISLRRDEFSGGLLLRFMARLKR
jgi:hypothetical protein